MLKTRLIPCMLFNGTNMIKTIKFGEERNLGNPVQFAKVYTARNVDELIFLDVNASAEGRGPLFSMIEEIVQECFMPLTIGGGIRTISDISKLLEIGADKVSINTTAINNPSFIKEASEKFGSQCIVVSIDVKLVGEKYIVFKNRGKENTGMELAAWVAQASELGTGEIFVTSIDRDGTMEGYDISLIKQTSAASTAPVIACGGAGKVDDIISAVKEGKADAVSLASMFHYSGHTSESNKDRMRQAGISVRMVK